MSLLVAPLVLLLTQSPAPQQENADIPAKAPASPQTADALVDEARKIVEEGANTPKNLRKALALYDDALNSGNLSDHERAVVLTDMSRAQLRLGDLASQQKKKIQHYEAGQKLAQRAQKADPKHANAWFWDAANLAVIGRTNGVTSSLFMLPELKSKLNKTLALDPGHHLARETIGQIYAAVPGLLGGDDDEAEKNYRTVLKRDPHFTSTRLTYAHFLIERDREDEAKQQLLAVLGEKKPSNPHDHRKFTLPDAKKALKELQ